MFAGKFAKRAAATSVHDDRFRSVIRDKFVVRIHRNGLISAFAPVRIVGRQNAFERLPKFGVEYRIDDGIKGGIGIAQPRQYFEGDVRDAGLAKGRDDVDAEERHPADEEDAHDDADRHGRFVVADVIRRTVMIVQVYMESFVFLLHAFLCVRVAWYVDRSRYGPYVFYVLLSVAVEPAVNTCEQGVHTSSAQPFPHK